MCIRRFIEKYTLYTVISKDDKDVDADKSVQHFQKTISDFLKPTISFLGPEIALSVSTGDIGLVLLSFDAYKVKSKSAKDKAAKITNALLPYHKVILPIMSLIVCDVCRMLERQIIALGQTNSVGNLQILANTVIHRVLNYISKIQIYKGQETSLIDIEDLARKFVVGVFEGASKKSSKLLLIEYREMKYEISCGTLLSYVPVINDSLIGEGKACNRKDASTGYEKIWGYRNLSLLADPCYGYKASNNFKSNSEEYELNRLDFDILKNYTSQNRLCKIKDFESLRCYSLQILKLSLCDNKTDSGKDGPKDTPKTS
ncbi:hypothetical protein TrispH2_003969 [Trichoplax sp. H2]|nr:hypothetical protein TrispH2_003969 [Trichoplax sp. H2]|eukprot:RDD43366.1 hypothetical protein TrispH2_003969 [Trichoplax sp. H2]